MRKTKNWIEAYLAYTNSTESPYLYREWSALSTVAAALQRKCYLEWGLFDVYPNLFVALVGPSGTGKTVAMRPARDLLREIGVNIVAQRITPEGLYREMRKATIDYIDPKSNKVYLHSSLTVHSSELAVFLGYQNRQFISDLCDLYDCDDEWEYKTKNPELTDKVYGVYLNILGGITPSVLQAVLPKEAIGGGLTSRIVAVYEEKPEKIVPIPFLTSEQTSLHDHLVSDLLDINQMAGKFRTTKEFIDKYIDWYIAAHKKKPFDNPQFDGYFTRRHLQVLKMSMIVSAAEGQDMIINEKHLRYATNLLQRTEVKMPHTFAGVGESRTAKALVSIMSYIGQMGETTEKELNRLFYSDADRKTIHEILLQIEEMGFCRLIIGQKDTKVIYNKKGESDEADD